MKQILLKLGAGSRYQHSRAAVALAPLLGRASFAGRSVFMAMFLVCLPAIAVETNSTSEVETAYTRTITQRADKIVATVGIADTNKVARVRDIIARQYRDLAKIHEERDIKTNAAKAKAGKIEPGNKAASDGPVAATKVETKLKLDKLHGEFLAKLSAELSPEQVDKVKDGLTYGVVPLTYGVYLKMYPELTEEQKTQIKAWLTEARELAMDGSTSDEKHAVFGKYKGKINNYLSKAGYDAKKAEQNLKKPAAQPSDFQPK